MRLIHPAEQIVKVAHDVLICTGQEQADVIRITVLERMQRQRLLDIRDVGEMIDLSIGVAGDIAESSLHGRTLIQPVDRHDRKNLAQSPMIEQALKDGKIA